MKLTQVLLSLLKYLLQISGMMTFCPDIDCLWPGSISIVSKLMTDDSILLTLMTYFCDEACLKK